MDHPKRVRLHDDEASDDRPRFPRWRDFIDIAPALKLVPPRSPEQCQQILERVAAANGIVEPLIVAKVENRTVLVKGLDDIFAADECGIPIVDHDGTILLPHNWLAEAVDPDQQAIWLNVGNQRQLTPQQRRELAAEILKAFTEWGDELIAEAVGGGLHHQTVGAIRKKLESTCEIHEFDRLRGKDGKLRPRRRRSSLANIAAKDVVTKSGRCRDCGDEFAVEALDHGSCVVCAVKIAFALAKPVERNGKRVRAIVAPPHLKRRETEFPDELRERVATDGEAHLGGLVLLADSEATLDAFLNDFGHLDQDIVAMEALLDHEDASELRNSVQRLKGRWSFIRSELTGL